MRASGHDVPLPTCSSELFLWRELQTPQLEVHGPGTSLAQVTLACGEPDGIRHVTMTTKPICNCERPRCDSDLCADQKRPEYSIQPTTYIHLVRTPGIPVLCNAAEVNHNAPEVPLKLQSNPPSAMLNPAKKVFDTSVVNSPFVATSYYFHALYLAHPLHSSTTPLPFTPSSASHLNMLICPSFTAPQANIMRCGWKAVAVMGAFLGTFARRR